ncbi:hypothetical protein AB0J86_09485 [Micromonospora sp. NPDC049559]|uniref:hypothetical protein n=1 Tax=Micromonospora sp. NPDC049559 TaxID=3155923 RepID=UPI00341A3DF8
MTIEAVKATIRQGIQAAHEAEQTIKRTNASLNDGRSLALATLHDSEHDEVRQARAKLKEAADEIELVLRRLASAKAHAHAYLGTLG